MSFEKDITDLVKATNKLTDSVDGKISYINSEVGKARKQVDDAIKNLARSHSDVIISYYDNTRHSLKSLAPPIDPKDPTKTEWVLFPTSGTTFYMYPAEGKLTKVHTTYCSYSRPGHYETPQYSKDKSETKTEFVLANYKATSEQINDRLRATNQTPPRCGGWWAGARVYDAPSVRIPGLHPYSRLFVRFSNYGYKGASPQNVLQYGGSPSVSVDRVINYHRV
ncbi:hypothetical protein CS022_22585 [Veronia nyctiphanis]|uniref:Uncharacterized protein n=1 Tax=Veronia nyctiphanis TaxID=1278244 RepID=A0A4Q0YJ24_9GAMM|nr:hypothetical protein [Veronia nyctiphanis]RXJ70656.1 hypothetical protein CS022_22585 [Veronia nyctiphanis]